MNDDSSSNSSGETTPSSRNAAKIELDSVSLRFIRHGHGGRRLFRQTLLNLLRGRREKPTRDFWVYRDLSLRIQRGERVGIIGRNGAGKSTLLKLIASIYPPTRGRVHVVGNVTPLIELRAGMNSDMTGMENIYLVGSLLGWNRKEIRNKAPEIISFSGIEDFIHSPVRCYSSGMAIRLAFSIATSMDPEILLLDEVLAVGDREFTPKAMERIRSLMDASHIMVLVSHNTSQIRELTNRTIWIDRGGILQDGPTDEVCEKYESSIGDSQKS